MLKKDLELLVKKQQTLITQLSGMVEECGGLLEEVHENAKASIDPLYQAQAMYAGIAARLQEALDAHEHGPTRSKGSAKS